MFDADVSVTVQENLISVEGIANNTNITSQGESNSVSVTTPAINNIYNTYNVVSGDITRVVSLNNITGLLILSGMGAVDVSTGNGVIYINGNTGDLIYAFYPLNSNPHAYLINSDLANYIQSNQTGDFSTIYQLNSTGQLLYNENKNLSGKLKSAMEFVIDGGGYVIETGIKGYLESPYDCTIYKNTLLADRSGSCIIDIWKCSYANFNPPIHPASGDKITSGTPPTIQNHYKSQNTALIGWVKTISSGDILGFNVNSCSGITRITISLSINL